MKIEEVFKSLIEDVKNFARDHIEIWIYILMVLVFLFTFVTAEIVNVTLRVTRPGNDVLVTITLDTD